MNRSALFFHILLGIILGLWISTYKGISLLEPSPLPSDWSVRAPAQDEFEGTPQVGQGISVRAGRLLLYRQQLYASDVLYRNDIPARGNFSITLSPDSGLVALGLIGDTTEYVFLSPQKLYQDTLDEDGISSTNGTYSFSMTPDGVFSQPEHIQLSENTTHTIEIMTAAQQSSIKSFSFQETSGQMLFQNDFSAQISSSGFLMVMFASLGGLLGWCISRSYGHFVSYGARLLIGLSPIVICMSISHQKWLGLGIRMYLVETPVWMLERWVLGSAYLLSLAYFAMHGKVWQIQSQRQERILYALWVPLSIFIVWMQSSISIWIALYTLLFLYLPLLLGSTYRQRHILLFEILMMH